MSGISLKVRKELLDKEESLAAARKILSEGYIKNMDEIQLAREIRFHALAYYFCERTGFLKSMKAHADPIDLHDGGDTGFRRLVYAASWKIPARKK